MQDVKYQEINQNNMKRPCLSCSFFNSPLMHRQLRLRSPFPLSLSLASFFVPNKSEWRRKKKGTTPSTGTPQGLVASRICAETYLPESQCAFYEDLEINRQKLKTSLANMLDKRENKLVKDRCWCFYRSHDMFSSWKWLPGT